MLRQCEKCNRELPLEAFYKIKNRWYGHTCKECRRAVRNKAHARDIENGKEKEYQMSYFKKFGGQKGYRLALKLKRMLNG